MKVGVIGLGRMGSAIATRVLGAGHSLAVYDRAAGQIDALVAAGAVACRTVSEVSAGRDVVLTMVTDDAALQDVAAGGLLDALPVGGIHLAMGTHGVAAIEALDAAHRLARQILVAAPVLGRPDMAAAGQLGIVVGGTEAAVSVCAPLFEVIGRRTFLAGDAPASASAIKIANNFLLGCAIEAMGEAFALVSTYGVTPSQFYDVMTDGLFTAPAYKVYGQIIVDQSYDRVGVTARIGLKDANLAIAAGARSGVPLPSAEVWRGRLLGAIEHGDGERDWAVMAREQRRASGLE